MTDRTVWRYTIPVDDQVHELVIPVDPDRNDGIVHVAARTPDEVEVWAVVRGSAWSEHTPAPTLRVTVTGTGHPVPSGAVYIGTAVAPAGLVWHLWRMP